ncbi:MAG: tRNA (adenosine(37)-N6)-threonylcarbamoyltransferase complex dimerization subunit type 1 TsaB [Lachnospiraceae bacterium]|nr:tRNA (adenosine(37)-N6)-threonylcarbamoyltransferase complex dimerization subunit type 1 TsaB [Lachnospiraceae bacterium]
MKLAALDSSGIVASAALIMDGVLLAEYSIDYKKTHSQTLLPMLDTIFKMTDTEPGSLDAVAVASGPGSFTGLRIGSATAKGLALALDIPIVEVPTLDAMAYQMFGFDGIICPMLDARRGQVYTALYTFEKDKLVQVHTCCAVEAEKIIEAAADTGKRVIFSGEGSDLYKELISERIKKSLFAPAHMARQRAGAVAALGALYLEEGRAVNADTHTPLYLRLSQAERERLEREKSENGAG